MNWGKQSFVTEFTESIQGKLNWNGFMITDIFYRIGQDFDIILRRLLTNILVF